MSTSKAETMPNSITVGQERQATQFLRCKLRWRQKYLIVTLSSSLRKSHLSALDSQRWLVECLKLSQVKGVCIDAALGEADVKLWVDACAQANKTAFLRLPPQLKKAKPQNLFGGKLQELFERAIAALLILLLSPILLGLFCISCLYSSQPLYYDRQWYASKRGKLFRLYKFQTITTVNTQMRTNDSKRQSKNLWHYGHQLKGMGQWLHKSHLDRLPGLFNVWRGEIGIVEQHYLTLEQAVRLSVDEQQLLETLRSASQSDRSVEKLQPAGVDFQH
jgi:lipopolysaccharide/colanic/teichoic acid biosynthesis glycosyltransferase